MTISFTVCWGGFAAGIFMTIAMIIAAGALSSWRANRGTIPKLER